MYVALGISGGLPNVEEAHEIGVVAVDAAEHLHGRLDVPDQGRLHCKDVDALCRELEDVLAL